MDRTTPADLITYSLAYEPVRRPGHVTPVGARLRSGVDRQTRRDADAALARTLQRYRPVVVRGARAAWYSIPDDDLTTILHDLIAFRALIYADRPDCSFASWLCTLASREAAKLRDLHRQGDIALAPTHDSAASNADTLANAILDEVSRLARERHPEDADLLTAIARTRDLDAALAGNPVRDSVEHVAEVYDLFFWRARKAAENATALVREAASSITDRSSNLRA